MKINLTFIKQNFHSLYIDIILESGIEKEDRSQL